MAIAFDSSSSTGPVFPGGGSQSVSHTCSGVNRILWAIVYDESFTSNVSNITSVTYNGVTMTLANSSYTSGQYGVSAWYLVNPPTGSHTLATTRSNTTNGFGIAGMSYTGAAQFGIPDASTTDRTNGNATVSVTTIADNCWTILGEASGRGVTASTGTTVRQGSGAQLFAGDSNGAKTPPGSTSMSVTESTGGTPGRVMVSFAPFSAIAFDNAADGGSTTSTPLTWPHTVNGTNTILFVATQGGVGATPTTTGVTYNGVAMTRVTAQQIPSDRIIDLWYLVGAPTGSHSVVATFTGTFCAGVSGSYNGVSQGALDNSGANTGSGVTTYTQSLSTVASGCWVLGTFANNNRLTVSSSGTTQRVNETASGGSALVDNNAAVAGSTSVTLGVQQSSSPISSNWAGIMVSIAPALSTTVDVKLWGAGGGGGGSNSEPGGAGAYVHNGNYAVNSGTGYTVTVGQGGGGGMDGTGGAGGAGYQSGGSGGVGTHAGGGGGGSTQFDTLIGAGGGAGGGDAGPGQAGTAIGGVGGTLAGHTGGGGGASATAGVTGTSSTLGAGGTGGSTPTGIGGAGNTNNGSAGGSSAGMSGNGNTGDPSIGAVGSGGAAGGTNSVGGTAGTGANGASGDSGGGGGSAAAAVATNGGAGGVPGGGGGAGYNAGSGSNIGGAGGNGMVIISAPIGTVVSATGGTHTTSGGNDVWTFLSNGTWTPSFGSTTNASFLLKMI